jgi:hypothetical protein
LFRSFLLWCNEPAFEVRLVCISEHSDRLQFSFLDFQLFLIRCTDDFERGIFEIVDFEVRAKLLAARLCVCEREPPAHFVYLVPERIASSAQLSCKLWRFLWLLGSRQVYSPDVQLTHGLITLLSEHTLGCCLCGTPHAYWLRIDAASA